MSRRVLPYGDRALLLELADLAEVLIVDAALRDRRPVGIRDVVPAARTILLRIDDDADLARVRREVEALVGRPSDVTRAGPRTDGDLILVPTVYDGADLESAADFLQLSVADLIAAHAGQEWAVAFCGFAPGFAYLTGGDPRLARLPRLSTPRTRVPGGSVALAAGFSAVYPGPSPGGWHLLGHTDLTVFDADRAPPALLQPGVRVLFVAP